MATTKNSADYPVQYRDGYHDGRHGGSQNAPDATASQIAIEWYERGLKDDLQDRPRTTRIRESDPC